MPRDARRVDLTLLLLVAPFFSGCARDPGPEDPHCVGADGKYIEDWGCEKDHQVAGAHWVYVPRYYYSGVGTAADHFRGATTPGSGHAVVSRGGFGRTGVGHAGG